MVSTYDGPTAALLVAGICITAVYYLKDSSHMDVCPGLSQYRELSTLPVGPRAPAPNVHARTQPSSSSSARDEITKRWMRLSTSSQHH